MPDSPTPRQSFLSLMINRQPEAAAWVTGSHLYPQLSGLVKFYSTPYGGILIEAEFFGLPNIAYAKASDFYGMHIHENGSCTGNTDDPFANTGDHYNPDNLNHPNHSGDLLPLFGNQGYAWEAFYDKRFTIDEILGKSVIIHHHADDFTSQPAGNSGSKIGCGTIMSV